MALVSTGAIFLQNLGMFENAFHDFWIYKIEREAKIQEEIIWKMR